MGFALSQTYTTHGSGTYALSQTALQTETGNMSSSSNDSSTGSWSVGGTLTNVEAITRTWR